MVAGPENEKNVMKPEPEKPISKEPSMYPNVKRILYATDLSPNSAYAFRYAADSARRYDARIDILHVQQKLPAAAESMLQAQMNHAQLTELKAHREKGLRSRIAHRLETLGKSEREKDPQFDHRIQSVDVQEGNPWEVILQMAEALHCDMIVLGSRGRGFLGISHLDSTSRRVLSHSRKPTYVIPLPEGETDVTFHDEQCED
jgi:nucleotide-binding universal stress UspA family protein